MEKLPLIVGELTINKHVDTDQILEWLRRIYRAVVRDTAAEEALAAQNEELRKQLEDLLSGETLPPAVAEKIQAIVEKIKAGKDSLAKAISETTPAP